MGAEVVKPRIGLVLGQNHRHNGDINVARIILLILEKGRHGVTPTFNTFPRPSLAFTTSWPILYFTARL